MQDRQKQFLYDDPWLDDPWLEWQADLERKICACFKHSPKERKQMITSNPHQPSSFLHLTYFQRHHQRTELHIEGDGKGEQAGEPTTKASL